MMEQKQYEDNPNFGSLHATKVKQNPKEPDYFGSIKIDLGTVDIENNVATVKLGGWKKESKNGKTYLSLRVNTWKGDGKQQSKPANTGIEDDDIPF
jgi:hypothetical protein